MSLREQLMTDLKAAMRAKDTERRNTIRNLQAAIKQEEIDNKITLDDKGILAVLTKQAKQRRESIVDYEKAGRDEMAAAEKSELLIIEAYLPKQMSAEEIREIAAKVIADLGVSDAKGMGQVMGKLMPQVKGKADGRLVNQVVRELLQN